jgi:hypothetical protein
MYEAEQQGIVPVGTFERMFQQPLLQNASPDLRPPPPPSWEAEPIDPPAYTVDAVDMDGPPSEPRLKVVGSLVRRAVGGS